MHRICIFTIIISQLLTATDFRPRKDSYFSPIPKAIWDKGFVCAPGFYLRNHPYYRWMWGGAFDFTLKRRARANRYAIIFNAGGFQWYQSLPGQDLDRKTIHSSMLGYMLPLKFSFALYKNGGNFIKEVGTVCPYFGLGFALLKDLEEDNAQYNFKWGAFARLGVELMVLPPSLGFRLQVRPMLDNISQGLTMGLIIDISIVTYLF